MASDAKSRFHVVRAARVVRPSGRTLSRCSLPRCGSGFPTTACGRCLIFYMIKGFLGYGDRDANAVYGAYTALVYMTPFFGGMIADRLLGARLTVVIGGLLMAAGHLLMTVQVDWIFYTALAFLIAGNGFFKPNISTIVGSLYPAGSPKRDGGFTIFYIGINLGAAMAPLLCGYIGETYGWH